MASCEGVTFAGNSETARPVPDIGWLKRQPLIAGSPDFREFD